jgi:SAM-dependent methyltransferase
VTVWNDPAQPDGAAATAYEDFVGRYGSQLAAQLVAATELPEVGRALDVGCGPGSLTVSLAERLGAENVAAIDPSEPFVSACRARVPGADVRSGEAERLPFASDTFDAVLAQLVLQLINDREGGIREMARVARPGAVIAACVWDWGAMPLLRSFWDAALAIAPGPAGAFDDARRVGYKRPLELGEAFEAAGLEQISGGELWVTADYLSFEDLWRPLEVGIGNSGACFTSLGAHDRRRLRTDAYRRLGEPQGSFRLEARSWWTRGLAPSSH